MSGSEDHKEWLQFMKFWQRLFLEFLLSLLFRVLIGFMAAIIWSIGRLLIVIVGWRP